jgi:hypothetical protein
LVAVLLPGCFLAGGCVSGGGSEAPALWTREAPFSSAQLHVAARSALLEMGYEIKERAWMGYVEGEVTASRSETRPGHRAAAAFWWGTGLAIYSQPPKLSDDYEIQLQIEDLGDAHSRLTAQTSKDGKPLRDEKVFEELWARTDAYLATAVPRSH